MAEEYTIHEVIISDSKGNLFNYHSDYMNENFSYDKEVGLNNRVCTNTQVQVMLEDKLQNATEVAQQLWLCS